MYDRRYAGRILAFEPSGGLLNAALVMRDRETDSWWSIITGDAIGGALAGTPLVELPAAEKTQWGKWKARYPKSKVLSVDGKEHSRRDPYAGYFESADGFRGLSSRDTRLADKASIYAFQLDGAAYAVPHSKIEGGAVLTVGGKEIFLYREPGSAKFASTLALVAKREGEKDRYVRRDGRWHDAVTGADLTVDPTAATGAGDNAPRLGGFDTFWYIWSTTHEHVVLLEPSSR